MITNTKYMYTEVQMYFLHSVEVIAKYSIIFGPEAKNLHGFLE